MTNSPPKIAIVGEAFGEEEERAGVPFFGKSGQELTRMLSEAGIDRFSCFLTNVFNIRPPNNDLRTFCVAKADAAALYKDHREQLVADEPGYNWPSEYIWPHLCGPGKFLHPTYLRHLSLLRKALTGYEPDLVFALGNTPCWALLSRTGVGKLRGYLYSDSTMGNFRVLPTYHPAAILRQWAQRPISVADFRKGRELLSTGSASNQPSKLQRTLWIEPTFVDLQLWWDIFVGEPTVPVACDIETNRGLITAISFGVPRSGISIPLRDRRQPDGSYWRSPAEELRVLEWIAGKLAGPNPKVFQNGNYDLSWLWGKHGARICGPIHDTMLQHHALQPELAKDLGFLGGTYTDVIAWKNLRKQAEMKGKAEKKDE